jgi:hypothetical protein
MLDASKPPLLDVNSASEGILPEHDHVETPNPTECDLFAVTLRSMLI